MIGVVVLAAGSSSRMGQPKQLLPYKGQSLLRHTLKIVLASGHHPVVVVLGANAEKIQPQLESLPVHPAYNSNWSVGMGSSIQTGIQAILAINPALRAVVILLCDQPLISVELIHRMIAEWSSSQKFQRLSHSKQESSETFTQKIPEQLISEQLISEQLIVACKYSETIGVPALFDQKLFPELLHLDGTSGAKQLIRTHINQVITVPFPSGSVDVDTPRDYQALLARKSLD